MPTGHWWTASGWEPQTQSSLKTDRFFWAGGQYEPGETEWHYYFLWGRRIVREADKTTTEKRRQMESVEQRRKGRAKQRRMNAISSKGEEGRKILSRNFVIACSSKIWISVITVWVTLCVPVYIHSQESTTTGNYGDRKISSSSFLSLSYLCAKRKRTFAICAKNRNNMKGFLHDIFYRAAKKKQKKGKLILSQRPEVSTNRANITQILNHGSASYTLICRVFLCAM